MPPVGPADAATTRLGPHVEQRHLADQRAYPAGAPLVVTGRDATMAIDASLGVTPLDHDGFLLSHFHEDHVVGVGASELPTLIHELDLPAVQSWEGFCDASGYSSHAWRDLVRDDFSWQPMLQAAPLLADQAIDLGGVTITPLHLPGHTPGHCGFLIEPDGVLYLGDIDLSGFGPYYGDTSASLADTLTSLARVRDIEASVYTTFHHRGHVTGRAAFHQALARHRAAIDVRHDRILTLQEAGHADAASMSGQGVVYRVGTEPAWGFEAEQRMIQQHLDLIDKTTRADTSTTG